jgi:flagellar hook assembly protein FlgD
VTPKKGAKVTYKNVSATKLKKYIKVDKKGKVTVEKKAPAGQYKIKVTIAKGKNYNKTIRTVKISVKQ